MKGVVFNAFFDHVEQQFGLETVEQLISSCDLQTGGAYTAVGTYEFAELAQILAQLSNISGESATTLLRQFGRFLFGYLVDKYPGSVQDAADSFSVAASVDQHIHTEVQKLYPDADLPSFEHAVTGPDEMTLIYRSSRNLGDLARGLLEGCFAFFGEDVVVDESVLDNGATRFCLRRMAQTHE